MQSIAIPTALRGFLPGCIEIGKGKVIGADSDPSQQVDIVIYDGRFPVLRQHGTALYPVEGVIATIEVKSLLTEPELHRSLTNCTSVMSISPCFAKEDADRLLDTRCLAGKAREDGIAEIAWELLPRTYVFAYNGMKQISTLANSLQQWLAAGFVSFHKRPLLPSVVVTGGVVGIAWGDPIRILPSDVNTAQVAERDAIMAIIQTETRFGILASHLLWHIERRLTLVENPAAIRRAINGYLPFEEYIAGAIEGKPYSLTMWREDSQTLPATTDSNAKERPSD